MKSIKRLTDESLMPYGIHKGEKMANVPASYLLWIFDNNKSSAEVTVYVNDNLDGLRKEVNKK